MRWRRRETTPELTAGPLVLELVPVYGNGATGALVRLELGPDAAHVVAVPPGVVAFRVLVGRRAGLYAGATTTVARESEPAPDFLSGRR